MSGTLYCQLAPIPLRLSLEMGIMIADRPFSSPRMPISSVVWSMEQMNAGK